MPGAIPQNQACVSELEALVVRLGELLARPYPDGYWRWLVGVDDRPWIETQIVLGRYYHAQLTRSCPSPCSAWQGLEPGRIETWIQRVQGELNNRERLARRCELVGRLALWGLSVLMAAFAVMAVDALGGTDLMRRILRILARDEVQKILGAAGGGIAASTVVGRLVRRWKNRILALVRLAAWSPWTVTVLVLTALVLEVRNGWPQEGDGGLSAMAKPILAAFWSGYALPILTRWLGGPVSSSLPVTAPKGGAQPTPGR